VELLRNHTCEVCGKDACFGYGVFLLKGKPGRWRCGLHREELMALGQNVDKTQTPSTAMPGPEKGDLF
jgi:ArsR family metal-binding transcriptional regulator